MNITIFGAGYVGVVSAACLLRDGHTVTAIDPVKTKVDDLSSGNAPLSEPGVSELLRVGHEAGKLIASTKPDSALLDTDMIWICVGTPSRSDGSIDLSFIDRVFAEIAMILKGQENQPLIVLRSTVLPGTVESYVIPKFESLSGLKVGHDIDIVFHPEFLREGTAIADFDDPPKIVVGELQPESANILMSIYNSYEAPKFRLKLAEAELVKYCDNLFHAVKVTFANEIGALAKALKIDGRRVADVFCADTKLNISPRYLRPGFAYGGSCLPKDTRALLRKASMLAVSTPLLESLPISNNGQIETFVNTLISQKPNMVGIVGLAFKTGTDDMRESPYVSVAKRLIGEGIPLMIFDPGVDPDRLLGGNKSAVESALGHLKALMETDLVNLENCSHIVVNHRIVDSTQIYNWLESGIKVIDVASVPGVENNTDGYTGIAW